VRRWGAKS